MCKCFVDVLVLARVALATRVTYISVLAKCVSKNVYDLQSCA